MNQCENSEKLKQLKAKANRLPLDPGVYIMKNKNGEIIYIGKAKALKNRVTQYFGSGNNHTQKVRKMVCNVEDFEYIICDSEFEALILENSLIKQNQPKYNILLKDDKGYFYIKITDEKWQRIEYSKNNKGKGEFIGPYNSGYIVKETVEQARKIFKLPDCNRNFDIKSRPCLNFHIGLCDGPCCNKISFNEYCDNINSAKEFIKNGDTQSISIEVLIQKMNQAAENLQFEAAARLRDRINAIKKIREKQKVVSINYKEQDVIATACFSQISCVEVLIFRNYRLTDKKHYFIDGITDKAEIYDEFLQRYYGDKDSIPQRILIDCDTEKFSVIGDWLSKKSGHKVNFINPKQGESKRILDMCLNNAAQNLSEKTERTSREMTALTELGKLLGLSKIPSYIEAYDISNTAGDNNVAGMVVFKDGRPYKRAYKRFKIKSFIGQDDYRSMTEVLRRRFDEYKKGQDEGFKNLPDLILLDGAKGQISAVLPVLEEYGIDVAVFGMVKDSKHRTRAIATSNSDIEIKSNRQAFSLVTSIQDEVHRFAISYHKKLQSKKLLSRELTEINGIGDKKANILLKSFGSLKKIKAASIPELASVKGITQQNAKDVFEYFNKL